MKRFFYILIFVSSLTSVKAQAPGAGISIESITPSSAVLLAKTSKTGEFVSSIKSFTADFSEKQELKKFLEDVRRIRESTDIDILDEESLKNAGIDTERKLGFALFEKMGDRDRMIIFIPVWDEKTFPLKFVEILKDINKKKSRLDVYPAVTPYRSNRIYQIQKDVFTAVAGGYFLIASTGELVKQSIDLYEGAGGGGLAPLSGDTLYSGYRNLVSENYGINIFAKKEALVKAYKSVPGEKSGGKRGGEAFREKRVPPYMELIDFVAIGFAYSAGRLRMSVSTNLKLINPALNSIINTFKTGGSGKSLYRKGANFNLFLSIDPLSLDSICGKPVPECAFYKNSIRQAEEEYGISYNGDFAPNFSGVVAINIDRLDPGKGDGSYVLFFPMKDRVKTEQMVNKMVRKLRGRYIREKRYGDIRIGGRPGFWLLGNMNRKRYYTYDGRGIFMGSSTELLKWALAAKTVEERAVNSVFTDKLGPPVFFLMGLKKESFISGMMKMRASREQGLKNSVNRIGDLYIRGTKTGNFLSVDVDIEVTGR